MHSWIWLSITGILVLIGCEPFRTTGRLGLVTKSEVNSAMLLLKDGQNYQELGPSSSSVCDDGAPVSRMPADNFARVANQAINAKSADALIDVTTVTHRNSYFPWWALFINIPSRGLTCTSVSGTAIEFIEPPDCAPCLVSRKIYGGWLQPTGSSMDLDLVPVVESLSPNLDWEPFPLQPEKVMYDIRVWRAKAGLSRVEAESIVYERHDLTEASHRIETDLEHSTHYLWAVRANVKRDGIRQPTRWSYQILLTTHGKPRYYHFVTP
jgi:hypothetical protein